MLCHLLFDTFVFAPFSAGNPRVRVHNVAATVDILVCFDGAGRRRNIPSSAGDVRSGQILSDIRFVEMSFLKYIAEGNSLIKDTCNMFLVLI